MNNYEVLQMIFFFFLFHPIFAENRHHDDHQFPADDIIELPVGRFPDPDCEYTVHRDGQSGPKINSDLEWVDPWNENLLDCSQVRVGDALFHSWRCSYGELDSSMYCLMVNNCTVSSEKDGSLKVPILDEFGCSLFPTILPHVEYSSDLNGGLLVHAFSLDFDKAAVFFECNVKLLLKLNGVCRRPICPALEDLQKGRGRNKF